MEVLQRAEVHNYNLFTFELFYTHMATKETIQQMGEKRLSILVIVCIFFFSCFKNYAFWQKK